MNRIVTTLIGCALAGTTLAQSEERPDRGGRIEWRQDLDAAFEDAARTRRPILLYFTADW